MSTDQVDVQNVSQLEIRRELDELLAERDKIGKQKDEASAAVRDKRRVLRADQLKRDCAEMDALDEEAQKIETPFDDQRAEVDERIEAIGVEVSYDHDCLEIDRCAKSGLLILEDDEVLEDPETYEKVLRCLVLPPRADEDDEDE